MYATDSLEYGWLIEALDRHGEFVIDLLTAEIEKKKLVKEGDLISSMDYKVIKSQSPKLSISFLSYGRAIEISFHRKNKSVYNVDTNLVVWGMKEKRNRPTRRKDTRFYARTVYGSLNRLIAIVSYEFSEEERQRIKNSLQYQITNKPSL